ncbi:MAG: YfiR family protein [Pseudomonadota bacterium]
MHAYAVEPEDHAAIKAGILTEIPRYAVASGPKKVTKLCIIGDKDVWHAVQKQNQKKTIFSDVEFLDEASPDKKCDIIYTSNQRTARKLIVSMDVPGVILVSTYASFVDEGGLIGLVEKNGLVTLELNLSSAADRKITLSPDLIEISKRVVQ